MRINMCHYTDSFLIVVDNHSSCSITNDIEPLISKQINIESYQGLSSTSKGIGTVKLKIEDDDGKVHDMT